MPFKHEIIRVDQDVYDLLADRKTAIDRSFNDVLRRVFDLPIARHHVTRPAHKAKARVIHMYAITRSGRRIRVY